MDREIAGSQTLQGRHILFAALAEELRLQFEEIIAHVLISEPERGSIWPNNNVLVAFEDCDGISREFRVDIARGRSYVFRYCICLTEPGSERSEVPSVYFEQFNYGDDMHIVGVKTARRLARIFATLIHPWDDWVSSQRKQTMITTDWTKEGF